MMPSEILITNILNNQICQLELISASSIIRDIMNWTVLTSTVIFRRRCFNSLRRRRRVSSYATSCRCRVLCWPFTALRRYRQIIAFLQ